MGQNRLFENTAKKKILIIFFIFFSKCHRLGKHPGSKLKQQGTQQDISLRQNPAHREAFHNLSASTTATIKPLNKLLKKKKIMENFL